MFDAYVLTNTAQLYNPHLREEFVAGGHGQVFVQLHGEIEQILSFLMPQDASSSEVESRQNVDAHQETLGTILTATLSSPANFSSGMELLCKVSPDMTGQRSKHWGEAVAAHASLLGRLVLTLSDTSCQWHLQHLRQLIAQIGRLNKVASGRVFTDIIPSILRELESHRQDSDGEISFDMEVQETLSSAALSRILYTMAPLASTPTGARGLVAAKVRKGSQDFFGCLSEIVALTPAPNCSIIACDVILAVVSSEVLSARC